MHFSTDQHGQISYRRSWDLQSPCRVLLTARIGDRVWWAKCSFVTRTLDCSITFHHLRVPTERQIMIMACGDSGFGGSITHCIGGDEPETVNAITSMVVKPNLHNVYYKSQTFEAGFLPLTAGVAVGGRLRLFRIKAEFEQMYGQLGVETRTGRDGFFEMTTES